MFHGPQMTSMRWSVPRKVPYLKERALVHNLAQPTAQNSVRAPSPTVELLLGRPGACQAPLRNRNLGPGLCRAWCLSFHASGTGFGVPFRFCQPFGVSLQGGEP